MKAIKRIGVAFVIIAIVCALGLVGRIETEDMDYRAGEITKDEMTSDEKLYTDLFTLGGVAVCGGLIYAAGCGMELLKEKREARERWFDDEEEIY